MKKSLQLLSLSTALLLFCWNGSMVDSEGKAKRPDVNFYGTIEDHTKKFYAEDILIAGKYEAIPVYPAIKSSKKRDRDNQFLSPNNNDKEEVDPKQNKALLDLHEVKSIELKHPEHPTASTIEINKRDYIEIIVTSINNTKKNYLIETSRKITCKEIDKGPEGHNKEVLVERELNIIHIKKMKIKGYKSIKESHEKKDLYAPVAKTNLVSEKKEVSKNTENLLDQIEENVKNLSQDNPSTFDKMKSSILTLLKALREQLQKMLNMLQ